MIEEKTVKAVLEYLDNQDPVRERLNKVYRRMHKPNFAKIAWSLNISPLTLSGFLKGNRKVELRVLWIIDYWVRGQEAAHAEMDKRQIE